MRNGQVSMSAGVGVYPEWCRTDEARAAFGDDEQTGPGLGGVEFPLRGRTTADDQESVRSMSRSSYLARMSFE